MSGRKKRGAPLALALMSVVALLAMFSATASATPVNVPMWSSGGATMEFGTSTEVSGQSNAGLNLYYKSYGGIPIWVTCTGLSVSGKANNISAGKSGTLTSTSSTTQGPAGIFQNCQLIEYGEKDIYTGLECTIPKELPTESGVGTLTNAGNPAGGLEIKTTIKSFWVTCPKGYKGEWSFTLSGVGKELWEGDEYFGSGTTKVEANVGGTGEVSYGIAHKNAKGPVTIVERAYEEPVSTYGTKWYLGGAERTVISEGPKSLLAQGSPASLSGGAAVLSIESMQSGLKTVISCSSGKTTGSVENPVGGGSGVGSVKLELTGCTVPKPEGRNCKVVGSAITTNSLPARVKAGSGLDPILELNQSLTAEIATFSISECTIGALNHVYTVTGQLFVKPQMKAAGKVGSWLVPASLNNGEYFRVFGQKATPTGEITAESGGKVVTMG
jgi:hypothetical protein